MNKLFSKINKLSIVGLGLFLAMTLLGCGAAKKGETIQPLYIPEPLEIGQAPIHVDYWADIGQSSIEPLKARTFAQKLFSDVPLLGDLVEFPMDLVTAILPPLSSISRPELPADASWNDPKVISIIGDLRLVEGFIRVRQNEEEAPKTGESASDGKGIEHTQELFANQKNADRCWAGLVRCASDGLRFLKEIRVYLIFNSPPTGAALPANPEILLAHASTDNPANYNPLTKTLNFDTTRVNLKPLLANYGSFSVKIIAKGGLPRRTVDVEGRLHLQMTLKLGN